MGSHDGKTMKQRCSEDPVNIKASFGELSFALRVCTLGFWVPKAWNMDLNKAWVFGTQNLGVQTLRVQT